MKKSIVLLSMFPFLHSLFAGMDNLGVTFQQQLDQVQSWAQQRVKEKKEVGMLLGVATQEYQRFSPIKQDNKWIYTTVTEHQELDPSLPYLRFDFNDLSDLHMIAKSLYGVVSQIWMDNSVGHCTEWKKEHLTCFKDMLKTGGIFVFNDCGFSGGIWKSADGTLLQWTVGEKYRELPTYHSLEQAVEACCCLNFQDGWPSHFVQVKYDGEDLNLTPIVKDAKVALQQIWDEKNPSERRRKINAAKAVFAEKGFSPNFDLQPSVRDVDAVLRDSIARAALDKAFLKRATEYRRQLIEAVFGNAEIRIETLPFPNPKASGLSRLIFATKND